MNILLVGEESAGIQLLKAISTREHRIVAVMASPPKVGATRTTLWDVAQNLGYPTWPAVGVKDPALADRLRAEQVDLLLNAHSLYIICPEVLGAAHIGAFNLHPGPLPRYAGLYAPSWALYRGEKIHGATVHWMEPGIDTGAIAYQELFPIEPVDTALTLSTKCIRSGVKMMAKILDVASRNPDAIPRAVQDPVQREYFGKTVPQNGQLSWDRKAEAIVNFIKACDYLPFSSPWGHPRSQWANTEVGIVKAARTGELCHEQPGTVGACDKNGAAVATGDEWLLVSKILVDRTVVQANELLRSGHRFTSPFVMQLPKARIADTPRDTGKPVGSASIDVLVRASVRRK